MKRFKKAYIVVGAILILLFVGVVVYSACTTITYSQGLGLPIDQITKVSITTNHGGYVATSDRQKIQD